MMMIMIDENDRGLMKSHFSLLSVALGIFKVQQGLNQVSAVAVEEISDFFSSESLRFV